MISLSTQKATRKELIDLELNFSSWLARNGKKGQGHSRRSIQAHVSDLRQYIAWFENVQGDEFQPALLSTVDLRSFAEWSIGKVKANTWNRRRASLALFCLFCHDSGLTAYNPFAGVPRMSIERQAPRSLVKTDYHKLQRSLEHKINSANTTKRRERAIRDAAIVGLLLYAGLRVSEVCGLKSSDLVIGEKSGKVEIRDGKGHKEDEVPLGREGRIVVSHWLELHGNQENLFGVTPRQVQRIIAEYGQMAGIEITPHGCRHTFVYNVLQETKNIAVTKRLARHARTDTTLHYAEPHREDLQEAVEDL
jgi:integrase/recombinase XerC